MLIFLPFLSGRIFAPLFLALMSIIALGLFAGLTSPKSVWVSILDMVISITALAAFEYQAALSFMQEDAFVAAVIQFLAIVFLLASYYNTKTVRNMVNKS